MDITQMIKEIEIKTNAALKKEPCSATGALPCYTVEVIDQDDAFINFDISIHTRSFNGSDPDPFAGVSYEKADGTFFYGFFKYDQPICWRGEISDPGGWDLQEYVGPFEDVNAMVEAMQAALDEQEKAAKAEAEAEAQLLKDLKKEFATHYNELAWER